MKMVLSLAVVSVTAFCLAEAVVAPRERNRSDIPRGRSREVVQQPRSKSAGPQVRQREAEKPPSPSFEHFLRKKQMKRPEIEEAPPTPPRPPPRVPSKNHEWSSPPPAQQWKNNPVLFYPERPTFHRGMSDVKIGTLMEQVNAMKYHDSCLNPENRKASNKRCGDRVNILSNLPSEYRTEACQRITDGKCRKTGTDSEGRDIYQCTCHPYTKVRSFKCLSRSITNISETFLLGDCVAPGY